ncbi:uncharacterized protein LOC123663943 [Melitaea cinxia]|uniref:uncharacterized protein LOC123663943 n=1 Tax=Melitaea cinxia TaxID=113334 RepID=UPI001E270EE8|nr:uncharacterized protein LOC123663943 [Melitaea cinxia]
MNRVWRVLLLDIVRYRLSLLRKRLEKTSGVNYYLYVTNNETSRKNKIKFFTKIYRGIADIADLISPEIHASMFVNIVCALPKLIFNWYHILLVVKGREAMESIGFSVMDIIQISFLLFSPCIAVELQLVEVENLRTTLIHLLIEETDMNRVWRFLLLDIVRHRLSLLRKRVEESSGVNYYLYATNNKTLKEDKIIFFTNLYRNIVDIADLISPEIHASMFISIVCTLPKIIYNIYHILLVVEEREPMESIGFLLMHIIQVSFLLCSPCIVVELLLMEIEKLRTTLIHLLMDETDAKTREDIQVFLTYTSIRTFQSKIWRCIPLNISLLVEIANICSSSIIVVINFTHLYD